MIRLKPILFFLAKFLAAYLILFGLWFVIKGPYGNFFRKSCEVFFGSFGGNGVVKFMPLNDPQQPRYDTKVFFTDKERLKQAQRSTGQVDALGFPISSRIGGYVGLILLLSFIIATPMERRRQLIALLWAFFLIHIFIYARMWFVLLFQYNDTGRFDVMRLSPYWKKVIVDVHPLFSLNNQEAMVAVAIFLWIAIAFRKDTWQKLVQPKETAA